MRPSLGSHLPAGERKMAQAQGTENAENTVSDLALPRLPYLPLPAHPWAPEADTALMS